VLLSAPPSAGAHWGSSAWGSFAWTEEASDDPRFERARASGVGKAISLVISNDEPGDWHLSAIQLKFIPKRRRD
jgi:hypothetical protein